MCIECKANSFESPGGFAWNLALWTNDVSFATAKKYWAVSATPTIAVPSNGSIVSAPVTVIATFAATGCTIAKVEFYEENRLLAFTTTAPYSFSWTGVSAGPHTIRAVATDGNGRIAVSEPVSFTAQ